MLLEFMLLGIKTKYEYLAGSLKHKPFIIKNKQKLLI